MWDKSRLIVMSIPNGVFLVLLFMNSYIIFHTNNYKSTFAPPCIFKPLLVLPSCLPNRLLKGRGFFKIYYLFIFRERGKEGEREGEKHQCVVASHASPTGDLADNPGMCPDWESNH